MSKAETAMRITKREKRRLAEVRAEEARRDPWLVKRLEEDLASLRRDFAREEERLEAELTRAYRAKKGTIYDANAWFRIKWRSYSGRVCTYPKKMRRIDGQWVDSDGKGLALAMHVCDIKPVKPPKSVRRRKHGGAE